MRHEPLLALLCLSLGLAGCASSNQRARSGVTTPEFRRVELTSQERDRLRSRLDRTITRPPRKTLESPQRAELLGSPRGAPEVLVTYTPAALTPSPGYEINSFSAYRWTTKEIGINPDGGSIYMYYPARKGHRYLLECSVFSRFDDSRVQISTFHSGDQSYETDLERNTPTIAVGRHDHTDIEDTREVFVLSHGGKKGLVTMFECTLSALAVRARTSR